MNASSPYPKVLGVLAGDDMSPEALAAWVESAEVVLAADGGADRLGKIGRVSSTTIGDLDSISPEAARVQPELIRLEDQNSTDCDKLLALASRLGHTEITLAGVEGDLLDHVLGTIQSAARSSLNVRFALRRGVGFFLNGPFECKISTRVGARFSMIPLDLCEGVFLSGTRWSLADDVLSPFGLTSLSNVAETDSVRLSAREGHVFVFVETDGMPTWDSAFSL